MNLKFTLMQRIKHKNVHTKFWSEIRDATSVWVDSLAKEQEYSYCEIHLQVVSHS